MKDFLNKLLNLGTDNSLTALDRRRIKTINLFNLIILFFLFVGISNFYFLGAAYPYAVIISFFLLSVFSLFLSWKKKNAWSFLVFTFNVNASVFFINEYYPHETGAYLYYYVLIISVVLLNNPNAIDKFAVFHFVICALSFLGNLFIDIPELRIQLSPEMTKILWYYNMFFSAIVTALLSILLTRFISTQNKEIYQQNIDLLQTKEAIDLSLKEKEVLLAELHHRVKNNLAIITGLVNLQGEATDSEEAKQVLSDTKSRIMSMALVHRMLYENADLKSIDIGKYSMELLTELFNGYNLHKKVSINCTFDPIMLPVSKSVPLGLILNEVVTNSIKYAYKAHPQQNGVFSIDIKLNGNRVVLTISDNGPGFPKDFNKETDGQSLGIYLIKTLVEQIDGSIEFSNNNGAQIRLNFNTN